MRLITSIFRDKLHRNPTDVELMDLFQSNNEHCRRYLCNGKVVVDGEEKPFTMNQLLQACKPVTAFPSTMISFGKDGSAIKGTLAEALNSETPYEPSRTISTFQNKNPVVTMTTHNFPSGVTPFPGAECVWWCGVTCRTGVGGQIREVVSTGNGAKVIGGASGLFVGNLNIPGYHQPWEEASDYPSACSGA